MSRKLLWIGYLSIAGCATELVSVENDIVKQPAGVPLGVAWIPPKGDVAINAASIEYVLYPPAPLTDRQSRDPLSLGTSTSTSTSTSATATMLVPLSVGRRAPVQLSPTPPQIILDPEEFRLRTPRDSCPIDE